MTGSFKPHILVSLAWPGSGFDNSPCDTHIQLVYCHIAHHSNDRQSILALVLVIMAAWKDMNLASLHIEICATEFWKTR